MKFFWTSDIQIMSRVLAVVSKSEFNVIKLLGAHLSVQLHKISEVRHLNKRVKVL